MVSKKQLLARERNWLKFRLGGMHISTNSLTPPEVELVVRIERDIKTLLEGFNTQSALLGLNVKNRCWCGKVTKKGEEFCKKEHNKKLWQ